MRVPDPLYQHHLGEDHQLPLRAVGGRVRHPLPAVQHPRCVHTCQARYPPLGQQQQRREEDGAEERINSKYNRFNFSTHPQHQFSSDCKFKIKSDEDVRCEVFNSNYSLLTYYSEVGQLSRRSFQQSSSTQRGRSHLPRSPRDGQMEGNRRKREESSLVGWLNPVIFL